MREIGTALMLCMLLLLPGEARADGQTMLLLLPAERGAELVEAVQVEVAWRGLSVERTDPPGTVSLAAGDAAALALARERETALVVWVDGSAGPLLPPTVRLVPADGTATRHARLSAALDVVEPRVFAVVVASLLDDGTDAPRGPDDGHEDPAGPSAAGAAGDAGDGPASPGAAADPEPGPREAGGAAPPPSAPPAWVVRIQPSGGLLLSDGPTPEGGTLGAGVVLGRYLGRHLRLEAGFAILYVLDDTNPLLGDLTFGVSGVLPLKRARLELGAAIDLGIVDERTGVGATFTAAALRDTRSHMRYGAGLVYNVWHGLAQDGLTHGARVALLLEVPL